MDLRFTQQINKGLIRILVLTVLANWFVLGIYFYKFGPGNWFVLSNDREIWAHFGTFYSGIMGPFVGLLAFIGIIYTILLQMEQLRLAKQQVEIQEMQRVLASISAQIDQMLNAVPSFHEAKAKWLHDAAPMSLITLIAAVGVEFLKPTSVAQLNNPDSQIRAIMRDIALSVNAVALEFHSLGWTLEKFQEAGGSETMVEFYKFRYRMTIVYLEAMNEITATSRIRNVIDVVELTQQVKMDIAKAA